MRISDWSSDVCSSDLLGHLGVQALAHLGSAMVHQHRAVTVHMHQSTRLIEGRHIERNAKLHGCERQPFFKDRKSVVQAKSVSVRVDLGGRRLLPKNTTTPHPTPPPPHLTPPPH